MIVVVKERAYKAVIVVVKERAYKAVIVVVKESIQSSECCI